MIGIITLSNPTYYNYGGVLQNYALTEFLRCRLPAEAIHCDALSIQGAVKVFLFQKSGIKISGEKKKISFLPYKLKLRNKAFQEFIANEIKPVKFRFYCKAVYKKINKRYSMLIVGSDQVWNPYMAATKKGEYKYFLSFVPPQKRVSYAASFGISQLPEKYRLRFGQALSQFHRISVREEKGADIVFQLTGKRPPVVIDPVFLIDANHWRTLEQKSSGRNGGKYILKYFLGQVSNKLESKIHLFAGKHKLRLLDLMDIKENISSSGPREFLDLIDHADFICTDSFHAVAFSILFEKPFVVFKRQRSDGQDMWSRLESLLQLFRLENRVEPDILTDEMLIFDNKDILKILDEKRQEAIHYLRQTCRF